jgi:hypothetical protein
MSPIKPSSLAVLLAGLALGTVPARAETTQCTAITSLPAVITAQGIYCLTDDLNTSMTTGRAIEIQANNVVLDLNGHRLGGSTAGLGTTASGVFALQRQNVTIRNGTIRGFYVAIYLYDSNPASTTGLVVEDMRIDQATFSGIQVAGRGAVIRHNQILFTGGTTANGPNVAPAAIVASGPENRVLGNDIVTVTEQGLGTSRGIIVGSGADGGSLIVGNRITQANRGIDFIDFGGTGKYRDNVTRDVVTPYYGGTDAGNNN